ncbi:hypothetical protein BB558_002893 [Smittium angustum]|uniref:Uncharacterized protein n=1 Tax=Smittium angustum TaxID=133377 RepID=A0A2U1J7K9_SMIAN|nr:hypothetical protein BB558_002893 [Smittium angustum]
MEQPPLGITPRDAKFTTSSLCVGSKNSPNYCIGGYTTYDNLTRYQIGNEGIFPCLSSSISLNYTTQGYNVTNSTDMFYVYCIQNFTIPMLLSPQGCEEPISWCYNTTISDKIGSAKRSASVLFVYVFILFIPLFQLFGGL